MADAPPPRKDKDRLGAIAKAIGYAWLIALAVGALRLDNPAFPDQYLSPLYWGRRLNDVVRGERL